MQAEGRDAVLPSCQDCSVKHFIGATKCLSRQSSRPTVEMSNSDQHKRLWGWRTRAHRTSGGPACHPHNPEVAGQDWQIGEVGNPQVEDARRFGLN